ncbi:phage tail tape measure C-terminal domain-containing protein [Celeribacter halophilus]|uniref:Phage tail tape measure protein, lambda family n=1 Tax=Celeribacter halophilus TaxID=576117 RepID=A0A1I3WY79_9RHOB|nr:phage tail tape measure C-terminal domain-containing protein [Celeribacter halophilus]PZX04489.1 lambda family phage tail tape measure protein [Celeribacter halophilus]SFK12333.1 phage tail tape measure protein, lambda family [Celeribacter halophilus]
MADKKVSVRLAAVGGQKLKQELRDVGVTGKDALQQIGAGAPAASQGLDETALAAARAREQYEQMAAKAALSGRALTATASAQSDLVAQINRVTGVTPAIGQTTAEYLQQGQALDDLRAKYNPVFGVIRQYKQEVAEMRSAHLEGALSADELAAAISRSRKAALNSIAAYKNQSQAIAQMSRASRGSTLRMQQLFYQTNDIGVSLAGGMNPFLVMAQQGTQIAQIYGFGNGGVGGIFKDLFGMVSKMPGPLKLAAIAIGAGALAVKEMQNEINETSSVVVTFGDTALATWQVIRDGISNFLAPAISVIGPWFQSAWDMVVAGAKWTGNWLIRAIMQAAEHIKLVVNTIPLFFQSAFYVALSYVTSRIHDMVWVVSQGINGIAEALNSTFKTDLPTDVLTGTVDYLSEKSGDFFKAGQAAAESMADGFASTGDRMEEIANTDYLGNFFDQVKDRATENALKRIAEEAKKTGGSVKKAAEEAATGWDATLKSLNDYIEDARDIGKGVGDTLVAAFKSGEDAIGEFVRTGKLSFSSMITSFIADMAKLAARRYIFGPIADALMGGLTGGTGFLGSVGNFLSSALTPATSFAGGGYTGDGSRSGGLDGRGGFLAMMHPQERVIDEYRGQSGGGDKVFAPVINFNGVKDAQSFRKSRVQIATDFQRGLSMAARGN